MRTGLDGRIVVFELIAILQYLAEKTGRFLPASGRARYEVLQWLVFQAANLGPANGQVTISNATRRRATTIR